MALEKKHPRLTQLQCKQDYLPLMIIKLSEKINRELDTFTPFLICSSKVRLYLLADLK